MTQACHRQLVHTFYYTLRAGPSTNVGVPYMLGLRGFKLALATCKVLCWCLVAKLNGILSRTYGLPSADTIDVSTKRAKAAPPTSPHATVEAFRAATTLRQ